MYFGQKNYRTVSSEKGATTLSLKTLGITEFNDNCYYAVIRLMLCRAFGVVLSAVILSVVGLNVVASLKMFLEVLQVL